MKLLEKIFIGLFLLVFGLQLLPYFAGKTSLFFLINWLYAFTYLIGGFWLINSKDNKKYFIPIVGGIAFSTSLFVLPITIMLRQELIYKVLPLLNFVLFLGLCFYIIIKRNSKDDIKYYKGILIRSAFILLIVGIFSYTPISFRPYRNILIKLNNGNEKLVNNLYMLNYTEEFVNSMDCGDCNRAVHFAEKANEAGIIWLGISPEEYDISKEVTTLLQMIDSDAIRLNKEINKLNKKFLNQKEFSKISGTFSNLYYAYKCIAENYYNDRNYKHALKYYLKAYLAVIACNTHTEYWDGEIEYAYKMIFICQVNEIE
ncbi:MAG TPA: hypothetical protein PKN32_09665 [Bacteroidales bacterium]|nr:hypothetical protein [Bacteroidales bacterium]